MDDSMIGRWLSEIPMDGPSKQSWSKPQLRRFLHYDKPIEYLNLVGEGVDSLVYRVRIKGMIYGLKIVCQIPSTILSRLPWASSTGR
jgi:hypothetical protein